MKEKYRNIVETIGINIIGTLAFVVLPVTIPAIFEAMFVGLGI